ncbi:MAG: single-stranded DNA-binding protein [bacterium]
MSRSLNVVFLIGHLTRPPVIKYTPNGAAVTRFSIATNRSFKKADGTLDETVEYHDLEAWGKLAEICNQLLTTGSYVHVTGELRTQKWTDQAGVSRSKTVIRLSSMISLTGKKEGVAGSSTLSDDEDRPVVDEVVEEVVDDMPF